MPRKRKGRKSHQSSPVKSDCEMFVEDLEAVLNDLELQKPIEKYIGSDEKALAVMIVVAVTVVEDGVAAVTAVADMQLL